MRAMLIKQITADVVIVITHHEGDVTAVETYPQWECEQTPEQLTEFAANLALAMCERIGGGHASAEIHDFRAPPA